MELPRGPHNNIYLTHTYIHVIPGLHLVAQPMTTTTRDLAYTSYTTWHIRGNAVTLAATTTACNLQVAVLSNRLR